MTVQAIRFFTLSIVHLALFPLPAPVQGSTTIVRGPSSEYGFVETARFPDCGVGGSGAFVNTSAYNRGECGIRCLMEEGCLSFEWGENNSTCSLFSYSALPHLMPKFGIVYADSVDPKVGEQHPCDDDPCLSGNICTEECYPNGYKCQCPPGLQGDTCSDLSPVDGGFTLWGNFSECSPVCRALSYRNCSDPWPVAEGKDCPGPNTRETECASQDCNVFPYVGCYEHSQLDADYGVSLEASGDDMTIPLCKEVCSYGGYKFAALQGQDCYCVRSMQTSTDAFNEAKCTTNCPGDSGEKCGGSSYSSVYSAGTSSYGTSYLGCFIGTMPNSKVIQSYSLTAADLPPTTSSIGDATTPAPVSATPAYSGLTARQCIEDCRTDGYRFASVHNASTCYCHHTLEGMDTSYAEAACDAECPGGDDMGAYCGGSTSYSTFYMDIEDTEFWTDWFNFDNPWSDGHDIETTAEVHDTMPWICDNPVGIECSAFDGTAHDKTGDNFNVDCTVAGGINCTQDLQVYYVNVTFNVSDWRWVEIEESYNATELQCEWITASADDSGTNATMTNASVTNVTMTNVTMTNATVASTALGNGTVAMGTNGTATDHGYLVCNNETMVLDRNVTVNETFLRLTWRLDRMSPQCNDYKFRLKCRHEPEKLIGCFEADDVNDTVTTDIGLDVGNCSTYCSSLGYPLLALSYENSACFCGNNMKNNMAFATQCFHTCGAEGYPCGGVGKQSVYYAGDCNLAFGVTKSQMSGTLMHNNDATDEYDLWFDALDQSPTIELSNFTNIGVNIPFELEIDLGSIRSFNRMETTGLFVSGIDVDTGVTKFRVGYKLEPYQDTELVTDRGALTPTEFSVPSVTSITSHTMGQLVTARYVTIYVDDYDMFPGIKLEMYGCDDG